MRSLWNNKRGITSLEYGILAGVLGLVVINVFASMVGPNGWLSSVFSQIIATGFY